MIKRWLITGDTHGQVKNRLHYIVQNTDNINPEETAVIILGDAGLNFYLNKTDRNNKKESSEFGMRIYCVRGNHEERPQNIPSMQLVYDPEVEGHVWIETEFPLIRYFVDGGEYIVNDKSILTIGGAYSIDKYYRLAQAGYRGFSGWFKDEQLSESERDGILSKIIGKHYDFVLTHTAPINLEPTDLFLNGIDQSLVDKSMERWLKEVMLSIDWNHWCFGHYHADRIEAPHVEQFFKNVQDMDDIVERWNRYDDTGELDWQLITSPGFSISGVKDGTVWRVSDGRQRS